MQPWDELRAGQRTVTVAWTPAWNPWCATGHYELQQRRPAGVFAALELTTERGEGVPEQGP